MVADQERRIWTQMKRLLEGRADRRPSR